MRNSHGAHSHNNSTPWLSSSAPQNPVKGAGLQGEGPKRPQAPISKPISINTALSAATLALKKAASAGDPHGGFLPSNPWATTEGGEGAAAPGAKSLLPWMDSIWGAPSAKPLKDASVATSLEWDVSPGKTPNGIAGPRPHSGSLAEEFAGNPRTAFLTPASVAGN